MQSQAPPRSGNRTPRAAAPHGMCAWSMGASSIASEHGLLRAHRPMPSRSYLLVLSPFTRAPTTMHTGSSIHRSPPPAFHLQLTSCHHSQTWAHVEGLFDLSHSPLDDPSSIILTCNSSSILIPLGLVTLRCSPLTGQLDDTYIHTTCSLNPRS